MSRITKTVVPFSWSTITLSFTQGTASTFNLATKLTNPQGKQITYSVVGSLPTGVTLSGAIVSYNGIAAVASADVVFRASGAGFNVDSAPTTVPIVAAVQPPPANTPPSWLTAAALSATNLAPGSAFSYTMTATDADTDPISFGFAAPPFGTITVSAQVGKNRSLTWAGNVPSPTVDTVYSFTVDATDTVPLTQPVIVATAGPLSIVLTWLSVSGATAYKLERSTSGTGTWAQVSASATSPYTDSGLTAGATWFYRLTASNATQVSIPSAAASATVNASTTTGDLPTLAVSSATGAWTFGQPIKKNAALWLQGPAGTQVDIRNRWPDGSAKFAVVSGVNVASATLTNVTANPYTTGLLTTSALASTTAVISFGGVSASFGTTQWASPFRTVTSGPVMSSWVFRQAIGSDTHLVAWLEVRAYSNGTVEVLPWIENGYLAVTGPTIKSGRAVFTLNGVTKYDSIDDADYTSPYGPVVMSSGVASITHHCRMLLLNGGALSHWSTGSGLTPTHNRTYFTATKLVPRYYPTSIDEISLAALTTTYSPMRLAYTDGGMGQTGYDPEIGLLPNTSALYLCSGDVRAYRAVLATGFSLANYCIHYRDEATNKPLLFTSHPTKSTASDNGIPGTTGGFAYNYADSHHPAAEYLPYLLTGWHWFAEELQFQVTNHYVSRNEAYRRNELYYLYPSSYGPGLNGQSGLRSPAWQWRTLGQAAVVTPDSDTWRNQLFTVMNYNAAEFRAEYETGNAWNPYGANVLGVPCLSGDQVASGGHMDTWKPAFYTASIGYVYDMEVVTDSTGAANLLWLRDWLYSGIVGQFGVQGNAAQYGFTKATGDPALDHSIKTGVTNGSAFTWYTTWGNVYTQTWGAANTDATANTLVDGNLESGTTGLSTSYWGNLQPAISYAVDHTHANSAAALAGYNRMVNSSNWTSKVPQFNAVPVWGVKPRSVA